MQTQTIRYPRTANIERFFFDAALATYAGGKSVEGVVMGTNVALPGSKEYRLSERFNGEKQYELLYVDTYFANGEYSGGETVIFFQDNLVAPEAQRLVPIWLMQYHGWCRNDDKGCLDFLKSVLRESYEAHIFRGGRGLSKKIGGGFFYENMWMGIFNQFIGKEVIHRGFDEVFWHRYHGQLLIPADQEWLAIHKHPADLA